MTRRVTLLMLPALLLMHAPAAHALGHWIMGGPVAALASLQKQVQGEPAAVYSAEPSPVAVSAAPVSGLTLSDHQVKVTLENGFARTEVTQVWANPNAGACEARYAMPLPKNASLSELTIRSGAVVLNGEVRTKEDAERIYEEEKSAGRDAGVAKKDEYRTFEFAVARVPAQASVQVRFVYYQPLKVDTGVARYAYPIERDGAGEAAAPSFWQPNVGGQPAVHLTATVKTAFPVEDVRITGPEPANRITRVSSGEVIAETTATGAKDLVVYYRLAKLPGRVEVIPYRAAGKPGTFMAVLTPGVDLPLIRSGADHVFVLDVSGSMRDRLAALVDGVVHALGELSPKDRFRILAFNQQVSVLTPEALPCTPENVARGVEMLRGLRSDGGTNLFDALQAGLEVADADRVTNVILVTDGVTNQGMLAPEVFRKLLTRADVRFHGFLMGNEANWPLMDTIARASGGHYQTVVNTDDIAGVLRLAHGKLVSEAIHDVTLDIQGGDICDLTQAPTRVYHGEQLVIFGRYNKPGPAKIGMTARIAGKPHTYSASFQFPEADARTPELERLHAMARCEELDQNADAGLIDREAARTKIRRLALAAQIVTDETSMVLLTDGQFVARGIHRDNGARVATEQAAQAQRAAVPAPSYTAQVQQPSYTRPAPHVSNPVRSYPSSGGGGRRFGGGAFDPISGALVLALGLLSLTRRSEDE